MKRICLVRHAKSSWKDLTLDDYERPLNKRGERDAAEMGARLAKAAFRPDLIVTSPARRAQMTARMLAASMDYPIAELIRDPEIYLAEPQTLLETCQAFPTAAQTVMLIGHNPGLTDFGNRLCGNVIDNLPTCAMLYIHFDAQDWQEIRPRSGTLELFDSPRNIAA